jgi:hypothetical protein
VIADGSVPCRQMANLHQLHAFGPSSESSTMCHHSKLNGTAFGIHDWLNYLWDQAAMCRKLVEQADDPFIKTELLSLASVCEEIADNIEDHLTGGSDHAPRGPLSRLS